MRLNSEQKKFNLGKWAGLIGGIMLTITGIIGLSDFWRLAEINIAFIIPYILTLLWGVIALIGVLFLRQDNESGDYILIYSGSLAIFGMFFPILTVEGVFGSITIYLSYHFGYVDPFIVLLGGIIDLLVRKDIILS